MKDMERWAKIQNRQKETVRSPSPVLKSGDEHKTSKAADAAFAIFERKVPCYSALAVSTEVETIYRSHFQVLLCVYTQKSVT